MFKICFFAPVDTVEQVKIAMFAAGAGKIGNYDSCSWQVQGEGQFRPLDGSKPAIGGVNQLEKVQEYKVEMVCPDQYITQSIAAMKEAHPYEEVAYEVYKLEDF